MTRGLYENLSSRSSDFEGWTKDTGLFNNAQLWVKQQFSIKIEN